MRIQDNKKGKHKNLSVKERFLALLFLPLTLFSSFNGAAYEADAKIALSEEASERAAVFCASPIDEDTKIETRLGNLFLGKKEQKVQDSELYLCPGGDAFGVKICGNSVTVLRVVSSPQEGKLMADDRIISIDGKSISSVKDVKDALLESGGKAMNFKIQRNGNLENVKVVPSYSGGEYHLGVILTDGTSGIGTVTYYDPKTGAFGGLGHGICAADGNEVIKMTSGKVTGVVIAGASRGEQSKPGELRGILTDKTLGTLEKNTPFGVFGHLDDGMSFSKSPLSPIPICKKGDVKAGEATVISTVKSGKRAEYSIRIEDINYTSSGTKSFKIKVTDETLISLTGGIVRGMSGSPIIQNGKLVGAVTHVMVANPTEGYGIFIENMLNAAQMPMQKAA